jgi:hypothetical protein
LDLREREWRRLHNEELHHLYTSPNVIRVIKSKRMGWVVHAACIEDRKSYNILVGKPEGKRPFGRPRSRWKDNTRMDLREIGWEDVDWIHVAQDRDQWRTVVNTVMEIRVP